MTAYECVMPHCRVEVYRRRDACEPCWDDRRTQLDALPELYVMTYALLAPGSRVQEITTIHVSKPDSTVPFNLVAFDTLEQAYAVVAGWWGWLRGARSTAWLTTGERFVYAVTQLRRYDGPLGRTDFAGDYVLDIWTVYRRLVVQCLPTAPRHLDLTCPTCDNATVLTRHADEYATCLTCRTVWPHSQLPIMSKKVA
jgi:ribosomal protein S27E